MKLMVVNSTIEKCGVFGFGYNIYRCLKGGPWDIKHSKIDNERNFFEALHYHNPTHLLINWHRGISVANWLTIDIIIRARSYFGVKFILMPHDEEVRFPKEKIDYIGWLDPTKEVGDKEFILGRPVIKTGYTPKVNDKLTIGYCGFLFRHKKVEQIKSIIGNIPCHINLHFAQCDYGRDMGYENYIRHIFQDNEFQTHTITNDFKTYDQLTNFLADNDINIFPYDDTANNTNRGISSIIDNALASNKPFMVSNSPQFRHLHKIDHLINFNKISLLDCVSNGTNHLLPFIDKWTPEQMQKTIERVITSN